MRPMSLMLVLLTVNELTAQQKPLHLVIDQHLSSPGAVSGVCSDTEFVRRVFLDVTGLPPSAEEVREFAADVSPDKRRLVVDRLLNSPHCDRHLTTMLDVMLMERRPNQHVPQDAWHNWLLEQVRERRPWNEIVRDILQADGDDPAMRPAARFFLDRQSEPHLLTRDVGRIFFGRDLQCAQCHNHPLVNDYLQADYHGLHAFLAPGYAVVRKITKKEGDSETKVDLTVHAEKAGSDLTFESVFFEGTRRRTGPRLPDDVSVSEEFLYPGNEYKVAPAEGVKSEPKISRRARLAQMATSGTNRAFNENIANRLWAQMLGQGLVDPVDLHHFDNPPTDPKLLEVLGKQFAAMNFNIREFLREIALSQVYQRPFDQTQDVFDLAAVANALLAEYEQHQEALEQTVAMATAVCETATETWDVAQAALVPVAAEMDTARKAYDEARKALKTAENALAKTTENLQIKSDALPAVQQAADASGKAADLIRDDAELKAAAELFAKRAGELQQAITQLAATQQEQTTAVEGPRADFAAKKESLDRLLAKMTPLETVLRGSEAVMLEKRRLTQQYTTELAAAKRKSKTLRLITELPVLRDGVSTADTMQTRRLAELETVRQQLVDQVAVVAQREELVTEKALILAEAGSVHEQMKNVSAERSIPVNAVQAAIDAAEAAKNSLPDDAVLSEVTTQLNERLVPLQKELVQAQTAVERASEEVDTIRTVHAQVVQSLKEAVGDREQRQQNVQLAETAVEQAQAALAAAETAVDIAVADLTEHWANDFTLASLKPLTPEQMCWSLLKVTGVYDRQQKAESDKLEAESPMNDDQKSDSKQLAARAQQVEQKTWDALRSHVGTFLQFYAAAAGQPQNDFFATADQALFVSNADVLNAWVAPSAGNVTERIVKAESAGGAAEELYLSVLSRLPSDEEVTEVSRLLATRETEREAVAKELVWGLITSIEFRFNH